MIAALYTHDTSRNMDPNGHIHALIANITKSHKGDYVTPNFYPLYRERYNINQIVSERFRAALHKLGYKTVDKDNGGHFDIAGVPRRVIDHFSSRSAEIRGALEGIEDSELDPKTKCGL